MIREDVLSIVNELNELNNKYPELMKESVEHIKKIQQNLNHVLFIEDVMACFMFDLRDEVLKSGIDSIQKIMDKYGINVTPGEGFKEAYDRINEMILRPKQPQPSAEVSGELEPPRPPEKAA